MLIDCGSSSEKKIGEKTLIPFLKSRGAGKLDAVFITHADSDHMNGVEQMLAEGSIRVENLFLPYCAEGNEAYAEIAAAAEKAGAGVRYFAAGGLVRSGKGQLRCLSPEKTQGAENVPREEVPSDQAVDDRNEQSLVLEYSEGGFKALFMGDAGKDTERRILEKYDLSGQCILKAGHHGSATSTSDELLREAGPALAVLSYGKKNRYGHPAQETLDALDRFGVRHLDTPECGAISIFLQKDGIKAVRFL